MRVGRYTYPVDVSRGNDFCASSRFLLSVLSLWKETLLIGHGPHELVNSVEV